MTPEFFIFARAVHFGACLLFFGFYAFENFIAQPVFEKGENELADFFRAKIHLANFILLPLIFLSGICWFICVTVNMSGEAVQFETLKTVWAQTQFGNVWKWRLIFLAAAILIFIIADFFEPQKPAPRFFAWLQFLLAGFLLGSLAFAGHGQETSHWHLFVDIFHLLAAGFWPAGLLPLFLLLRKLRNKSETENLTAQLVNRFSICSLIAVALLSVTGLINSFFLVGSISNLFSQPYGEWLLVKIFLFALAVVIGAVNLLRLKPRLARAENFTDSSSCLRRNILFELIFATIVIIIVAVLGILPPAIQ